MIRLLKTWTRIALVTSAMVVADPPNTSAQMTEPVIESSPEEDTGAVDNAIPTPAQSDPPAGPALAPTVEIEIQRHINELRREQMDDRETYFDRLLAIFAIGIAIAGYFGFKKFQKIEAEARKSVETAEQHETAAKEISKRIEGLLSESEERVQLIRNLTAEAAVNDPDTEQAVKNVRENPQASLTDKAIANAISLQQQGKRDEAIEKWRAVAHIAEESDNALAARAWFSVGYLLQDGSPQNGILAYSEAIRLKPNFAEAYTNRGGTKHALGRHEEALADYDEAILLNPELAEAFDNRGLVKFALGRHEEALADHDKAIHLKPDLAGAYNHRGLVKFTLERYAEALADDDEAIRLKPNFAEAYSNRGLVKFVLGRNGEALADCDEAIRLKPNFAGAYTNRGAAKQALGRHEEALADYDEAIRLKPDDDMTYSNRGAVKAVLGLKDEARKDFETALELARNADNASVVAQVEHLLRDLDTSGGL